MKKGHTMTSESISDIPKDIQKLTFEAALSELEETVKRLESGRVSLDESVTVYTRGTFLKRYCLFKLNEAEAKIDKLLVNKDGTVDVMPFDA
jgi:exodeoxyribonuclease VII small subunit